VTVESRKGAEGDSILEGRGRGSGPVQESDGRGCGQVQSRGGEGLAERAECLALALADHDRPVPPELLHAFRWGSSSVRMHGLW
jgi:hypothetical protein